MVARRPNEAGIRTFSELGKLSARRLREIVSPDKRATIDPGRGWSKKRRSS